MKQIFFGVFFLLACISCVSTQKLHGVYEGTYAGETVSINFEEFPTVLLTINGEQYSGTAILKDDIVEIWQERKIPPLIFKVRDASTLVRLQRNDLIETDSVLKKSNRRGL